MLQIETKKMSIPGTAIMAFENRFSNVFVVSLKHVFSFAPVSWILCYRVCTRNDWFSYSSISH